MKLQFFFRRQDWSNEVAIFMITEDEKGNRHVAKPMMIEFVPMDDCLITEPTFKFSGFLAREFFPALVQGLAESGYKYESSDAGELKATKKHLEDMRSITMRGLDVAGVTK